MQAHARGGWAWVGNEVAHGLGVAREWYQRGQESQSCCSEDFSVIRSTGINSAERDRGAVGTADRDLGLAIDGPILVILVIETTACYGN
jgi:hypothetical protein